MKARCSFSTAILATVLTLVTNGYSYGDTTGIAEADISAGGAARVTLVDIIITSPPSEMLNEEDFDLVQPGWRTPDDSGELTLFANGSFSLARKLSGKDAWENGTFGTDGNVLVLKTASAGKGGEWRYRLVEFGVVPRRFGLKLETKGSSGAPPAAFYDAMQRHFLPVSSPVNVGRGDIELFPIGWSRTGLFAYVTKSNQNDGRGAEQYVLSIFDTVQDVLSYEHVVVPMDRPIVDELRLDSFRYVWAVGAVEYRDKLAALGIIPYRDSGLPAGQKPYGAFPLASQGVSYTASVALTPPAGSDPVPFSVRRTITVKAQSAAKGSKTVTTLKDKRIRNATISGWLKSPFEERIAVIVELQAYERNWESPPALDASGKPLPDGPSTPYEAVANFFLTGCNLKVGFKK